MEAPSFDVYLLVFICIHVFSSYVKAQQCTKLVGSTSNCQCTYKDGSGTIIKTFDFTPLAHNDTTPAFSYDASVPPGNYYYAYNPCYAFKDKYCTTGTVAACQRPKSEGTSFDIGEATSAKFSVNSTSNDIIITYISATRKSIVAFHCDKNAFKPGYTAKGEDETTTKLYHFTINTCLACLDDVPNCGGGGGGGGGGGSLTVGGIICIVFSVLVVVYIVVGVLVQKFARGAQGKELIPNYSFWADFPLLVKDGFMFLIGLCRGDRSSDYEAIK